MRGLWQYWAQIQLQLAYAPVTWATSGKKPAFSKFVQEICKFMEVHLLFGGRTNPRAGPLKARARCDD